MANGRLGAADLASATLTSVYTVPVDTFTVVSLSLCNRGNQATQVRVAIAATAVATTFTPEAAVTLPMGLPQTPLAAPTGLAALHPTTAFVLCCLHKNPPSQELPVMA